MPTIAETISKVNSFAELPEGWHYGEGVPPSEDMRQNAIKLLRVADFLGITRANAFPGNEGEVEVGFYTGKSVLELTLELDGSITIAEDESNEQIGFCEGASWNTAFAKLREFSEKIWDSSESSTQTVTIRKQEGSPAQLFSRLAIGEFPLSSVTVPFAPAVQSVNMYHVTTLPKQESLLFTGGYRTAQSQLDVAMRDREVLLAMIATTTSTVGAKRRRGRRS
jgi:hypothetical protein